MDDFKRVFDAAVLPRPADAQPVETAPREEEEPLLLYCPEHGGWQMASSLRAVGWITRL